MPESAPEVTPKVIMGIILAAGQVRVWRLAGPIMIARALTLGLLYPRLEHAAPGAPIRRPAAGP